MSWGLTECLEMRRLSTEAMETSSDKIELGFVWSVENICNDFPWRVTELGLIWLSLWQRQSPTAVS